MLSIIVGLIIVAVSLLPFVLLVLIMFPKIGLLMIGDDKDLKKKYLYDLDRIHFSPMAKPLFCVLALLSVVLFSIGFSLIMA